MDQYGRYVAACSVPSLGGNTDLGAHMASNGMAVAYRYVFITIVWHQQEQYPVLPMINLEAVFFCDFPREAAFVNNRGGVFGGGDSFLLHTDILAG